MDEILRVFIFVLCGLFFLVLGRWFWLRGEREQLSLTPSSHEAERFDPNTSEDEYDRTYSARVIKRLRTRLIEGRVEIHWEFHPGFIHRGFVLTAKCRRNDREWSVLALEPYQDSGSWIECFNYGESRSYLFVVKKAYRFFFGLFGEPADEIVYDQISFSVRKGKFLKEKAEVLRDRRNVIREAREYHREEQELREILSPKAKPVEAAKASNPIADSKASRLERRLREEAEMEDLIERKTAEINAHPTWTSERKLGEIERLKQRVTEMGLED
jgi:hypothetical protein